MGTIFIYLCKKYSIGGWKRICFYKGTVEEFSDPNPPVRWLEMIPDEAIGEVEEPHLAGIVGIRLSLHDSHTHGKIEWTDNSNWKRRLRRRPGLIKVRAYIF